MTFLPAESLDLGHGDALDADGIECVFYFVELEWFDYRLNLLHEK